MMRRTTRWAPDEVISQVWLVGHSGSSRQPRRALRPADQRLMIAQHQRWWPTLSRGGGCQGRSWKRIDGRDQTWQGGSTSPLTPRRCDVIKAAPGNISNVDLARKKTVRRLQKVAAGRNNGRIWPPNSSPCGVVMVSSHHIHTYTFHMWCTYVVVWWYQGRRGKSSTYINHHSIHLH